MVAYIKDHLKGIDVFKYIMSITVIAIHVSAIEKGAEFPSLVIWFIRLAVPFFFIVSGFLLGRSLKNKSIPEKQQIIRKRSYKIFRLFGLWLLIYFPLSLTVPLSKNMPFNEMIVSMALSILIKGENYLAWPLWYLYSLGLTTLAMSYLIKNDRAIKLLLIFTSLTYLGDYILQSNESLHYLLSKYHILKYYPWRVFSGGMYIIIGYFVHKLLKHEIKGYQIFIRIISCLILSLTLFYLNLPYDTVLGGIALFIFAYFLPTNKQNYYFVELRIQSMWIYYTHMFVLALYVVLSKLGFVKQQLYECFITVTITTLILAYILSRLQTTKNFHFLNILTR